jgi:hypothetical protein
MHLNKSFVLKLAALAGASLLCGCITTPGPKGQTSYAYELGDRAQLAFDEVVVSQRLKDSPQPYQNLHVGLTATINPLKTSVYEPYTVSDVLQRLQARIDARVVEALSGREQSLTDMPTLRARVEQEAQAVVDEAMQRWKHGAEYQVKVLVVSLYWTDASVGRAPAARRGWW